MTARFGASMLALALAATLPASGALAKDKKADAAAQKPAQDLSPAVRTAVVAAQAAYTAKDYPTAVTQLQAAQTAGLTTIDDKFFTGQLEALVGQDTKDHKLEAQGIDNLFASGKLPPEAQESYTRVRVQLAAEAKDYATAEQYLTRLNQMKPNDYQTLSSLANINYQNGKFAEAQRFNAQATAAAKASNQPVDEQGALQQLQYAYSAKDLPATVAAGQALIAVAPGAPNWKKALGTYLSLAKPDPATAVDVYRLMRATNSLDESSTAAYADYLSRHGLPGETVAVINEGVAAHRLTGSNVASVKGSAVTSAAQDRALLPKLAASAKAASDGTKALNVGDVYLGTGQYSDAAAMYRVAVQKGADAATANLRLGMALAMDQQNAPAKAAFAQVQGPKAAIAGYWTTWVDHP